jgi:Flp pilus assembly protein TadD
MHTSKTLWIALALVCGLSAGRVAAESSSSRESARLTLIARNSEPADAGPGRPDDVAIETLAAAVEADPDSRPARFDLVRALMRAGKLDQALAAARAWRLEDAYNLVVVRLLGDIYSELGDTGKALRAYSAVVELLPEDPYAHRALASVLKQRGNLDAAYQRLNAAARLRPDDMRIAFELADAAHRLGRLDEARERFEEISTSENASMAVRYPARQRLAQIYAAMRREARSAGQSTAAAATAATAATADLDERIAALDIKGGVQNDIKVYLTWDTDRSDVDLWVTNPAGEKVFYSHKTGRFGGALYDDVTTGYGPESFTARHARPGTYVVEVNYYAAGRGNFSEARGEVVIILHEGSEHEQKHVLPYRLYRSKQTVTVANIQVR